MYILYVVQMRQGSDEDGEDKRDHSVLFETPRTVLIDKPNTHGNLIEKAIFNWVF
jgi:hypothetical protein